jgi:SAM-dependent MidA family methyltransferase
LGVSVETKHSWEILVPAIGPQVSQKEIDPILQTGSNFAEGYTTEIHPHALEWVMNAARTLKQGLMMLIDYGFPESEYYHPQRNGGTLMAHHHHRANSDVLELPGISDITCHINFSNLMRPLENESGAELFFSSQASYLLNAGIGDLVLQKTDPSDQKRFIAVSNEIQKLISEAEMGELFKVMAFGKNLTGLDLSLHTLPGFSGRNRLY